MFVQNDRSFYHEVYFSIKILDQLSAIWLFWGFGLMNQQQGVGGS